MKSNTEYYYVACDGGLSVNESHRHYFRLYEDVTPPILVEQGLVEKINGWETKYGAELNPINPYPNLG